LLLAQMKELRGMRRSVGVPVRRVVAPSVIRTRTGNRNRNLHRQPQPQPQPAPATATCTGNRNLHPHLHVLLQLLIGKSQGVKG
jgi:hypothetical protein